MPEVDVEELQKLFRQLPSRIWEGANALKVDPVTHRLGGEQLGRFREKEAAISAVLLRIRMIVDA